MKPEFADEDWDKTQKEILKYLEEFLARIEWKYSDNRAPVKYPPDFYLLETEDFHLSYNCMIEENIGSNDKMYSSSLNPCELFDRIKREFSVRFPSGIE